MKKLFLIQGVYRPEADFPRSIGVSEPSDSATVASQAVSTVQAYAPTTINGIIEEMGVTGLERVSAAIALEEQQENGASLSNIQAACKASCDSGVRGFWNIWWDAQSVMPNAFK